MEVRTVRDLGAVVRQARSDRHLTQAELADRVGVSRDWVVRLEKGSPRLEAQLVLDALAAAGVTLTTGTSRRVDNAAEQVWDAVFDDLTASTDG